MHTYYSCAAHCAALTLSSDPLATLPKQTEQFASSLNSLSSARATSAMRSKRSPSPAGQLQLIGRQGKRERKGDAAVGCGMAWRGCNCWQLETVATVRRLWRINVNNIITNVGKGGGGGNLLTAQLQLHCQRHQSMCERQREGEGVKERERERCVLQRHLLATAAKLELNEISIQFGLMNFNEIHTQTISAPSPPLPPSFLALPFPPAFPTHSRFCQI